MDNLREFLKTRWGTVDLRAPFLGDCALRVLAHRSARARLSALVRLDHLQHARQVGWVSFWGFFGALHFGVYNFVRKHHTLGTTPSVAAGLEEKPWSLEGVVEMTADYMRRKDRG